MKALQILEYLCYMGETTELFNIVDVPENDDDFCENYFGYKAKISAGKYFVYWTFNTLQLLGNGKEEFIPNETILTKDHDSYGFPVAIYFYRIDD